MGAFNYVVKPRFSNQPLILVRFALLTLIVLPGNPGRTSNGRVSIESFLSHKWEGRLRHKLEFSKKGYEANGEAGLEDPEG